MGNLSMGVCSHSTQLQPTTIRLQLPALPLNCASRSGFREPCKKSCATGLLNWWHLSDRRGNLQGCLISCPSGVHLRQSGQSCTMVACGQPTAPLHFSCEVRRLVFELYTVDFMLGCKALLVRPTLRPGPKRGHWIGVGSRFISMCPCMAHCLPTDRRSIVKERFQRTPTRSRCS